MNYSFKYATYILIQIKTSIIKDAKFVTCVLSAVLIRITGFNAKKYKKKYISEAKCSFFLFIISASNWQAENSDELI